MARRLWLLLLLCGSTALAQERSADSFGGALAPALLPAGSSSLYAYVGAPEVGAGFRQGLSGLELEGRADFNLLLVSGSVDGLLKYPLLQFGETELAPFAGLGFVLNSGSIYFDSANFQYVGLRPRLGAVASTPLSEIVRGLLVLDVPWTFTLSPQGGTHVSPRLFAAVEFHVAERLSGFAQLGAGPDWIQEPRGVTQLRLGLQLKLGLGMRLF